MLTGSGAIFPAERIEFDEDTIINKRWNNKILNYYLLIFPSSNVEDEGR